MINRASLTELSRGLLCNIMLFMVLWKMPRARARQFFSSGLGFGLETQKPGLGLETCWTRTRTRVLRIWTRTRTRTRDMWTRTRLGLEETRTRCISDINSLGLTCTYYSDWAGVTENRNTSTMRSFKIFSRWRHILFSISKFNNPNLVEVLRFSVIHWAVNDVWVEVM